MTAILLLALLPAAARADRLLAPDWHTAVAQTYLHAKSKAHDRIDRFSLPVLGFERSLFGPSSGVPTLDEARFDHQRGRAVPQARQRSTRRPILVELGSHADMISAVFRLGSPVIAIVMSEMKRASQREHLRMARSGVVDENGGPKSISSISISVLRFGIPYSASIDCQAEAHDFCRDPTNAQLVAKSLTIIGGRPQ